MFSLFFLFMPLAIAAQEKCLKPGRLQEIVKQLESVEKQAEDLELHKELIAAARELSDAGKKATLDASDKTAAGEYQRLKTANVARVCTRLNTSGWPRRASVGSDGAEAFLFLVARALPIPAQLELYPIVSRAFDRREIEPGELMASYVDRLRLAMGAKQLFGSQVFVKDGFLEMAPIERPADIDERRAEFKLSALRDYERYLERSYRRPLIRSVMEPKRVETPAAASAASAAPTLTSTADDEKPIASIETAFVKVDVVVADAVEMNAADLAKGDFRVFDNEREVAVETFSKTEAPFDIVLLLDLSGSTADKVGLIKKTTRRFIEMKRPVDRIAVVSFHDVQKVVSELEADKEVLLKRIKDIDGRGASYVWDAIKFGIEILEKDSSRDRRKAIVVMSDGVDNRLTYTSSGSKIGFADLVEAVQYGSAAVFPIYLDTEGRGAWNKALYADARSTLRYLADQSGGNMYTARKIEELSDIYDQVLKDVGTVYSLGFTPDDTNTEKWRRLRVEVPSRQNLKLKHRPGYFVK